MRLNPDSLKRLPGAVARPLYDRAAQKVGIVHFGIGAFHRAHQALYTDAAMNAGDRNWAITGVSMRSGDVAAQMNPQAGLYTIAESGSGATSHRVVGAVAGVCVASTMPNAVIAAIAAPETHIISFTVTEKGYCRTASGDLDHDSARSGFYPLIAEGLARRHAEGLGGLTFLSCDNLAANGRQLERLLRQYLQHNAPGLVGWFDEACSCPCAMVDRIVPATTDSDRRAIRDALGGVSDEACVVTEAFSQWVIEDRFAGPRPGWERVGAQLVADVAQFEMAKLRILNGAHSALAYCGLRLGLSHVHEAVAHPVLRPMIERLMRDEAKPTIATQAGRGGAGQDLDAYIDALLMRFANPALNHRLIQIAMDGSQKIPQRWLETLAANQRTGRPSPALLTALAAWIGHIRGDNSARWGAVEDPCAEILRAICGASTAGAAANQLFGTNGALKSEWTPGPDEIAFLETADCNA